eukprot:4424456-Pleurochrysis_carterae.AAC.2
MVKPRRCATGGARVCAGHRTSDEEAGSARPSAIACSNASRDSASSQTRAQAQTSGVAPEGLDVSPVSAAHATQRLPPEKMTKAQLLAAYNRLLSRRRCAERTVMRLQRGMQSASVVDGCSRFWHNTAARVAGGVRKVGASANHMRARKYLAIVAGACRAPCNACSTYSCLVAKIMHAIDNLVQTLTPAQRETLRGLPSMQQECFISSRDMCATLRKQQCNPSAALSVRLESFLSTRALDRANAALSEVQRDEGTWTRPVRVKLPGGCKTTNRALGIHPPVRMFNVLPPSKDVSAALNKLVKSFGELA